MQSTMHTINQDGYIFIIFRKRCRFVISDETIREEEDVESGNGFVLFFLIFRCVCESVFGFEVVIVQWMFSSELVQFWLHVK